MKLLAYADLQATEGHERCFFDSTIPLQRYRVERFYEELHRIYVEHECVGLIDLGDTTDDRTAIPVPTIRSVTDGLAKFPDSRFNIKLIGNHEQWVKSGNIHIGNLFKPKFNVVDNRTLFAIDGTIIFAASFPESDQDLAEWIVNKCERYSQEKKILFGHFQLAGCAMNSGISLIGVPNEVMKSFDFALLGHVHRGQEVVKNVFYVGSPFQQNFGEANEDKRVAVIETDTATVEWVPMTGFPSYRTVSLDEFLQTGHQGEDRFKVFIQSPEEAQAFYASPLSSRVVEPIYKYQLTTTVEENAQNISRTPVEILRHYVQKVKPADSDIVVTDDDMVDFGLQIAGIS